MPRFPYLRQATAAGAAAAQAESIDRLGKHTVVSDMLRIEVFPALEIIPSSLLITPNMRYTLHVVGGPRTTARAHRQDGSNVGHVEIKFGIAESDIATVDQYRDVTGHKVGDATLTYQIIQLTTQQVSPEVLAPQDSAQGPGARRQVSRVVSGKTVPIRVRLVTDIEIPNAHERQIYT